MYMYACNFHFVNERECILFFTHYDIFLGQMSYVNHQKPRLNEGVIIQIMGYRYRYKFYLKSEYKNIQHKL